MPGIRIVGGELRHPITITQPKRVGDGAGGWTTTWTPILKTRGFIRPMRGRELLDYQQIDARLDVSITIRYNPGVRVIPEMQVTYATPLITHTYLIHAVIDTEERRHLIRLICEERKVA